MFIWNWITGLFSFLWYLITFQWIRDLFFGKKKVTTDLSCHYVRFIIKAPSSMDTLKKEFKDIFGGACQLCLDKRRVPYLDKTYGKFIHESPKKFFGSFEEMLQRFNNPTYMCCGMAAPLRCIIPSSSLEKMKNSKCFAIIIETDWTEDVQLTVMKIHQQQLVPVCVANELASKQIEDRCGGCGADISKTLCEDLETCTNCQTPFSEAIKDPKNAFDAKKVAVNIHKTMKQLCEEIGYAT